MQHPNTVTVFGNYLGLLVAMDAVDEARAFIAQLGRDHPLVRAVLGEPDDEGAADDETE
ncbi:MAG: hypothetical protein H6632_19050 [Anaerolineales bacterium]|nr:hypothetical protein [Anaerolineales bacterium]